MGGRGSSFSDGRGLDFGNSSSGNPKYLFPSQLNRLNKTGDQDRMIDHFHEVYGKKNSEYLAAIDENGYVVTHIAGQRGSVTLDYKGMARATSNKDVIGVHVTHNHPYHGWGNFSGADLMNFAQFNMRSHSAVSTNLTPEQAAKIGSNASRRRAGTYKISKTKDFKASDFTRAIAKVKVSDSDYDRTLTNWLRANQKRYGYKFTFTPSTR